jgi:WS/DGAT/MGAT family acyltransferase
MTMKQMSALDASFLYLESSRTPMHIGSLNIYSQETAEGGLVTFKGILADIEARLHLAKPFRQRAVPVPLSLDHPWWIEDPDFDLEFHVRHIALPAPGDWRQLCIQTARLHSRPLDLDRPLWEFTVIEGLDNIEGIPKGSFAVASKMHHAAIDGVSGAEINEAVHNLTPKSEVTAPAKKWKPEPMPTAVELLTRAGFNNLKQPFVLPPLIAETVPAIRRMQQPQVKMPSTPGEIPRTRFSGKVSPHRVFEGRTFDLEAIKAIKNSHEGATINDAVLTICGGAIRRYLDHHGELPASSLVAMAPVSVRTANERGSGGNQVSAMSVALRTDIVDPVERLAAVHETTKEAKELTNAVGARLLTDYTKFLPSVTMAMATRLYSQLGDRVPIFNCVVTNVPGPQFPLYAYGAKMVATYGYGPVVDGLGLFIPILSYDGKLTIGVTSCREMMPDPGFFSECIQATFDELAAGTAASASSSASRSTSKPAKPKVKQNKANQAKANPAKGKKTQTKVAKSKVAKSKAKGGSKGKSASKAAPKARSAKS